jgi:tRNA pseudouridine55 synthase
MLYDKPAGISSAAAVARVRRAAGKGVKVGHAGTLDPFATGLLLVLVGRATRVQRFLMALPKTYEATARFGATSSTGDPEGEIVETGRLPAGDLTLPTGVIRQRPPAFSAVKIGGRRAYQLARAGVDFETAEREVEVYRFGDAYCEELRRTRIGSFDVADSDPERIVPLTDALDFLPAIELSGDDARRASHGVAVPGEADGIVRLTDAEGLIALADPTMQSGSLKPIVGFR